MVRDTPEDERTPLLSPTTGESSNSPPLSPTIIPYSPPVVTETPATPATRRPNGGGGGGSWPLPAGLPMRGPNDENLVLFRRALGINSGVDTSGGDGDGSDDVEKGRKTATGIYKAVLREQARKSWQHLVLNVLLYACHVAQVVIGAVLTALGPSAADYAVVITVLGASNTVIAGILALIKGQGLPERLRKDELEFRKLQDWVEETEQLIAVGVVGKDRAEVGMLVEIAFKKYNAAKASEENNSPNAYVRQQPEEGPIVDRHDEGRDDLDDARSHGSGNAIVRLNLR